MTESQKPHMKLNEEQLEVFRVLYPLFKEEVFRRREQMMRLSATASGFLVLMLVFMLVVAPWNAPTNIARWFAISGVALFSGLFAYLILQQSERHQMAKYQVIELEKGFGLYKEGWQPSGNALYPKNWQSDWLADRSVTVYLAVIAALTALVIGAILIRL
ncbi:MAG: hypothetical protein V3T42_13600 [Nitrospirales bacterium]